MALTMATHSYTNSLMVAAALQLPSNHQAKVLLASNLRGLIKVYILRCFSQLLTVTIPDQQEVEAR